MDYISNNKNNKKYMLNQSGLANPYKNINLEVLREREAAIINTANWWSEKIQKTASEFEKESEKLDLDWQKLEFLQKELEHLQLKGKREEDEYNKFLKTKQEYLLFSLMSGIQNMKL